MANPPVCKTCKDMQRVYSERYGAFIPCTRCPVPCQKCRAYGTGAFCQNTPCDCACHRDESKLHPAYLVAERSKDPLDDDLL
jgi:hypothetical protein